mgnify:CR=1 FL=1|jgi:hypothetical protein
MKRIVILGIVALVLAGSGWGLYRVIQPDAHEQRLAHLRQLQIPAAGAARFAFLKQEMPDIVGQITCSCCAKKLIQCYNGACPVNCGPCNEQGKKTYDMYVHGKSIAHIQAYMSKNHPVGASRM